MIQIQIKMTWRWRWLEDKDDLNMKMTWRWKGLEDDPDDTEKKTCGDKLCWENNFLVKRECLCNCNFRMYSLVFIMYCNLMLILGCICNVLESCHNPMFILGCICNLLDSCHTPMFILGSFYNVNKSCQVIVGNPPIGQGLKSPPLWGPRVIRLS